MLRGSAIALALAGLAAIAAAPPARRPTLTREQMESSLDDGSRFLFVYGTQRPLSTPALRARATAVARHLFGRDSAAVLADREVPEESLGTHSLVLVGTPAENLCTRRLAAALPVTFTTRGFRWFGRDYDHAGDVLHLVYPNPFAPARFVLLMAANSPGALAKRAGFFFGDEDWRIERDGELLRSGRFAQSAAEPWRYDPALDDDRQLERSRFAAGLRSWPTRGIIVQTPSGVSSGAAWAAEAGEILGRLDAVGLVAPAVSRPRLVAYRSLEEKGRLTRDTRPEHVIDAHSAALALPAGCDRPDFWSAAALRLTARGASPAAPFLEPAAAAFGGRWGGESLERAIARLYFGRLLPTAREAASRGDRWRSRLMLTPARAALERAIFECAGARGPAALAATLGALPPGTLDSLCLRAGVSAAEVERRYDSFVDSLARRGQRSLAAEAPRMWRPRDGFARGICLAHDVSLERGYLSASCARELGRIQGLGANWVSITPFGYLPSPSEPLIDASADGGPDEETDEAVCEAAARAHALGMSVMLAPHLWTRGWTGGLDFGSSGWPRFFEQYRSFLLHQAVLAEREHMEALMVGHELTSASLQVPDRWRALIGDVRRVYGGTVTYGANWDREAEGIAFWDACDAIGVSFYYPLATAPGASVDAMTAAARRALAGLGALAHRTGRPVFVTELGYAASSGAAVKPWEEERSGTADPDAQRACFDAALRALDTDDWLAGVFVWKWFTGGAGRGNSDRSYSPQGKPAENVIARAFQGWRGRPVRAPLRSKP